MAALRVHIAELVIATDPATADVSIADSITERAEAKGLAVVGREIVGDVEEAIRAKLEDFIGDPNVDVVIATGVTESTAAANALRPLVTQPVPGFTDLFRWLAFQEIGASAMLSNAEAAQCTSTFVFVLPSVKGAVIEAMNKLILPQLDPATMPKNLVMQIPRLAPLVELARAAAPRIPELPKPEAVPHKIDAEKTESGPGISARMPAGRAAGKTGPHVIRKEPPPDVTRQIDRNELERTIRKSESNDAVTRPAIDIRTLLPRVPPGADEDSEDEVGDTTDITGAAPPQPLARVKVVQPARNRKPPTIQIPALPGKPGPTTDAADEDTDEHAPVAKPTDKPAAKPVEVAAAKHKSGEGPTRSTAKGGAEVTDKSGEGPTRSTAKGGTEVTDKSGEGPTRSTAKGGTEVNDKSGEGPTRSTAKGGAEVNDKSGEGPTRSTAKGGAEVNDKSGEGPTRSTAKGGAEVNDKSGEGPTRSTAKGGAEVNDKSGEGPTRSTAKGGAEVTDKPAQRTAAKTTDKPADRVPPALQRKTPPTASVVSLADLAKGADELDTDQVVKLSRAKPATRPTPTPRPARIPTSDIAELDADLVSEELPTTKAPAVTQAAADTAAPDDEEIATIHAKKAPDEAPVVAAKRTRPKTEPPPPPAKKRAPTEPPVLKVPDKKTPEARGARTPTEPPPPRDSLNDLPRGKFVYPVRTGSTAKTIAKWTVAVLLAAAAGVAFVHFFFAKPEHPRVAIADAGGAHVVEATADAAAVAEAEPDAAIPEIEIDVSDTGSGSATGRGSATPPKHPAHPTHVPTGAHVPHAGSGAGSNAGSAATGSETVTAAGSAAPPEDPSCDEVSCVLEQYARPCCARYKPADSGFHPAFPGQTESLDKVAVKEGIEGVKPRVIACGEKFSAKGTVKITMTVAPNGSVKDASVADSPSPDLGTCVAQALRTATFLKTAKGGSFVYPFVF